MKHPIMLIPGDGIGPEVTNAALSILRAAGVEIEWEPFAIGAEALTKFGDPLPDNLLDSIRRNKVAFKGPVLTPVGTGFVSSNVRLRKSHNLYANLRPIRSLKGVPSRYEDVDLIVIRENTENLYSGVEHEVIPGVVESIKIITEHTAADRIQNSLVKILPEGKTLTPDLGGKAATSEFTEAVISAMN